MISERIYSEIDTKLKDIFMKRFSINLNDSDIKDLNDNLLGKRFNLQPRDLLYLYCDVENTFSIIIPQHDIAEGRFNSYNNIVRIIYSQLMEKV